MKANNPDFTIMACNDAYKVATYTGNRDVKGLSIWEVFTPDTAGRDEPAAILQALRTAVETKQLVKMSPFQYNIPYFQCH